MELTPEEKQRIYEEEKERLAAQEKIKYEAQQKKNKPAMIGCLSIIGFIVILIIVGGIIGSHSNNTTSDTASLNANVSFNGLKFFITNNDNFDWSGVSLYLDDILGGYELTVPTIIHGQTYSVGAMQFTKDGNRFNPFRKKPQKFYIVVDNPKGAYQCGWNSN